MASNDSEPVRALTMSIESATGGTARIAALSESGTAFCIERTGDGSIRYGSGGGEPEGERHLAAFERAIGLCGSMPWSQAAVRMPDTTRMCDGLDPSGGYLICRMVQALIVDTMRRTQPS